MLCDFFFLPKILDPLEFLHVNAQGEVPFRAWRSEIPFTDLHRVIGLIQLIIIFFYLPDPFVFSPVEFGMFELSVDFGQSGEHCSLP